MKKFKSIFIFLILIIIAVAVSYWAYNKGYFKPNKSNTNNAVMASNNANISNNTKEKENNKEENNTKTQTTDENNSMVADNDSNGDNNFVGKEEVDQTTVKKEETESIETKAINAVKKEWIGDSSASFVVDNNNKNLSSDEIMIKVNTSDGGQYFYIYNTKTETVSEF